MPANRSSAGYSGTPLARKLGIAAGMTVALIDAPADFVDTLAPCRTACRVRTRLQGALEVIVRFTTSSGTALERRLPALRLGTGRRTAACGSPALA